MRSDKLVPTSSTRSAMQVANSRFIVSVTRVSSTDEAKAFLAQVHNLMPDASHHVYAFRIGHGNSIIEGMSDAGEPSGTAGPPLLAVLRGNPAIGDIILVVTRHFGGTKLGTGGLVRAYTEAAQLGISNTQFEPKITRRILGIEAPYAFYDTLKRLIQSHDGYIEDETFAADVTVIVKLPEDAIAAFKFALSEASAGQISPISLDS